MPRVATMRVALYGSLGLTGPGHGSDKAVLLGLEGEQPSTVDADAVPARLEAITRSGTVWLLGEHEIPFTVGKNLEFNRRPRGCRQAIPGGKRADVLTGTSTTGWCALRRRGPASLDKMYRPAEET